MSGECARALPSLGHSDWVVADRRAADAISGDSNETDDVSVFETWRLPDSWDWRGSSAGP